MIRESDEECLVLIASIRDRAGETAGLAMRSETERLLFNLEARIAEAEEWRTERGEFRAESSRLHAKEAERLSEIGELRRMLAKAGEQIIALTGERDRAFAELEEARRLIEAMYVTKEVQPRGMQMSLVSGPIEDCPCGTETCREAWRELRQGKADDEPTEAETRAYEQARVDLTEGMPNFRDMIREEVAAEVARQQREPLRAVIRQEIARITLEAKVS